jgi:nicotinate-nucleotide adenylyltransferase
LRIGILGGTFDPPHNGHLLFAKEALFQFKLDKVLFLLTPSPPHKEGNNITRSEIRHRMLEEAISGKSSFEISHVDMDRPAPHYTVDTIRLLKKAHVGHEIIFLMGGDSLMDLPETWHEPQLFVERCDGLGVYLRTGVDIEMEELEGKIPGIAAKVNILESVQIDVSSTQVRSEVSKGLDVSELVPASVNKIIKEEKIYILDR